MATFTDVAISAGLRQRDGREQAGWARPSSDYNGRTAGYFKTNFSDDTPTLYRNDGGRDFFSEMLISRLDSACIRNIWAGHHVFRLRQ